MGSNAVVRRPHFAFMATQKKKQDTFSPVDSIEMLGELEKVVKIQSIVLGKEGSLSTGNLCLDLITGGIKPGWYTFAGAEQSAKTTSAITAMGAAISQKVPLTVLWDAENSTGSSMDYVESIFKTSGLNVTSEELFGVRKDGKYVVKPLVYYRDEGEMETFFGWVSGLLRRLPDKRFEDGRWWYIYEGTRENKAKYKDVMDRHLSAGTNGVYIPAEDGSLQAYILCDSYPSLLPASLDEDDAKSGMALQAREFSKHIPKVKGKLRAKRVAIVGINQIRKAPGVMYGDPNYEPCGEALKFMSDIRVHYKPRALSGVPFNPKGKGSVEEEPSITGDGVDVYRYINAKAIKNKLSIPGRDTWLRIWVSDVDQVAHGFDPVWDTFYAMSLTGQVEGKRHAMKLNVHGQGEAKKSLNWEEFKTLILGNKDQVTEICSKIGYKPMNLRKGMFNLFKKGILEDLYIAHKKSSSGAKKSDDEEETSDED
jgi:RecA/RadA recombinase